MDFTLKKYEELCRTINESKVPTFTFESFLSKKPKKFVILRHDVDRKPRNALKMALLENGLGLHATYYFRVKKETFRPQIIKEIKKLGHEIGYHYEVLDKSKGDYEKAIEIFKSEIKFFKPFEIKTICMHGNPLTKWDNRSIWNKYSFSDFGIVGEAYLSIDFGKVNYFTDTGRRWNSERHSIKDVVDSNLIQVKDTDDLIGKIRNGEIRKVYLLTHPCRWNDGYFSWTKELVFQNIKNVGKGVLKWNS